MTHPPSDFNSRTLLVTTVSGYLYRSFSLSRGRAATSVLYFGRAGTERYDSPDNSYGVCYLGRNAAGCFIETFGQTMPRVIDSGVIEERGFATISATSLNLLDITGPGAFRIGATGAVWAGDRALSRNWSKVVHDHPDSVDGILYAGNHDSSEHSVALFERAQGKVSLVSTIDWSDHPDLGRILDRYDIGCF